MGWIESFWRALLFTEEDRGVLGRGWGFFSKGWDLGELEVFWVWGFLIIFYAHTGLSVRQLRVSKEQEHFLVAPQGLACSEVTAASLVSVPVSPSPGQGGTQPALTRHPPLQIKSPPDQGERAGGCGGAGQHQLRPRRPQLQPSRRYLRRPPRRPLHHPPAHAGHRRRKTFREVGGVGGGVGLEGLGVLCPTVPPRCRCQPCAAACCPSPAPRCCWATSPTSISAARWRTKPIGSSSRNRLAPPAR